jgi:hypothetical protein
VSELARAARRGAPVVIFLKRRTEDGEEERMEVYQHASDQPAMRRFFAFYTVEEARDLVESAGLEVIEIGTAPDARQPDVPGWVSLVARK